MQHCGDGWFFFLAHLLRNIILQDSTGCGGGHIRGVVVIEVIRTDKSTNFS